MTTKPALRRYRAPDWNEPIVMEMSRAGRRGVLFPALDPDIADAVGPIDGLLPAALRRARPAALPEMSEPDVLRHYLHLSQQTLGMMGISLFGTCTMKYNARVNEAVTARDEVAETHPRQHPDTLQGTLDIIHRLDLALRELSGMDRFVFQAAGGADAAYTHACITRAYHAARGELETRDEIITTIQTHPCNPATAATAGFKVITLMLDEHGYPSLDALKSVVSNRTAALMINNPDDMGIYNPHIKEWVRIVHEAGGLCFYDHANFNGVMSKIRARELGFDACMFMLHKTFGAPKGGGGPAVGAYGCSAALAPYLPGPLVVRDNDGAYRLEPGRDDGIGRVREFFGNVQQVVKAYAWVRAMGADGIAAASDLSVLANNYMTRRLALIRGVTVSHPHLDAPRMEMTRFSLETLHAETGIGVVDVQNRMIDFGVDAFWLAHEPWIVPQPFTPEAGEMWSKEDIDYWIAVLEQICHEAYTTPDIVRTAPHHQPIGRIDGAALEDPARWAMTWRAHLRKRAGQTASR
ncbi:aminomethyl-transferring glycine dehydrogenase subunit GcvPB [Paraburkholderia caballeronis]|uniref:aminomethyl-transferring glycine dehydrogenase subunit GcvPB n=1 Tax=Paraburkholderia caballeronis TaxID=416943 RepID=UPI001066297F|nr:aminomethyl-transferring glycine dehydrogenase subunit GcvPB [Paraburkholderia caballeronis]TDV15686.1 glycine dehydrogenase (decarboxylating) beta subunit [Paraburkholderia caballeronis]TDV17941.1 glycine dehydrogenase (decarboxylating) beta subunit [Paraburkholderia caballeronis]TDV26445.1 glycine dehydrogenase (decarboxylating) beta subunit [Paraburkholderia caballeronis]